MNKNFSFLQRGVWLLALTFIGSAAAQTNTNAPSALQQRVLRSLIQPARTTPASAAATDTVPLAPADSPAAASRTNPPTTSASRGASNTLAQAIRTMNFERTPDALFNLSRAQQAGGRLSEVDRFRVAVLLGDWAYVATALKNLPADEAMPAYSRLLDSLAANSQSVGQFFQQSNPSRATAMMYDEDGNPMPQQPAAEKKDKRGLLLSGDFYAILEAAPGDLTASHVPSIASLAKVALGPGGRKDLLARLKDGLKGIGDTTPDGHKLAAQLLSTLGWIGDAGPYLPLQRSGWDAADTLTLVLTLEHFTQNGIQQRDERELKRAAELCAFMMQASRFSANDRGLFKQATDRFVKLLPALDAETAEQLIRENFLTQPEIMVDLMLALGESGQQALKGSDLTARGQSVATANLVFRVLEGKKSALPEAVNVLVMNWLGEAEQTYRYGWTNNLAVADYDNPYLIYRPPSYASRQSVRTLPPDTVLSNAPPSSIIRRLNRGLAQRVNLTQLKVNLINPKEPVTLETLKGYLKEHPGQEKELCQDYLASWVRKRTVAAEDPNIVRMRNLGYVISRQQPPGIPLTRLRQNQNVRDFTALLAALRGLSPEPLDAPAIIQSFMAIHSGAEVYRLEDIEAIFGPPEKMNRQELMSLVTGMRVKLRDQWQDPKVQQDAGTNRSENETKDEVSRGYRTALELVRRGLKPEDAEWKQFIVRGQLFFDAAEYEFARQIKLSDYINLRDEAFGSYRKAAEIYAAKIPDMPKGQWSMEPYQMWFFVMLGASDLSQLTRAAARSDPGLKQIGDAMRALPGEAAEAHLGMFGKMLGDVLSQVPANMRQRFLSAGLQVVGENHASAKAAVDSLRNYRELMDEAELRLTVDGPTRVGHTQPFGVFLGLEHTRQLARESGGFTKYLQNPNSQRGYSPYVITSGGQRPANYRDDFAKNIHAALDETFEVASITFHDANVKSIELPREGWQETPLAYVVLRAKDAAVDRIPSIQIDMDFSDTSGQVILPVRSQVQPIDAKENETAQRPCADLTLTMTLDEREWRDGKVVVEVSAKGQGIIPSHEQMFDFVREGFDVEVTDNGLSVAQFVSDGRNKNAQADRGWQFTYKRKKDLRGDVLFKFPGIKPGIKVAGVEYKHYQDADLVSVDARQALAGVLLRSKASTGLRVGFYLLGAVIIAVGVWLIRRVRRSHLPQAEVGLALPAQITPFSVVAFLRRIQHDGARNLDAESREALKRQIRDIEAKFFSGAPAPEAAPDLEAVARKWLQAVN